MILPHKKKANVAAGVWLVTMAMLMALIFTDNIKGNVWSGENPLAAIIFLINGSAMAAALWFFSKAKGYWGILGLFLFLFNVFGLMFLLILRDRAEEEVTEETLPVTLRSIPGGRS